MGNFSLQVEIIVQMINYTFIIMEPNSKTIHIHPKAVNIDSESDVTASVQQISITDSDYCT